MTIDQIREIIKKDEFEVYGIRVDENKLYEVGDTCYTSHQWWYDDPGEESGLEYNESMGMWDGGELSGTCALAVNEDDIEDVLEQSKAYYGDNISLIAGNDYEIGYDIGEVIIREAKVIAIIQEEVA